MQTRRLFIYLFFLLLIVACEKPPDYSDTPRIEFLSITKVFVSEGEGIAGTDEITIFLRFEDGDGDLGINQLDAEDSKYANIEFADSVYIPEKTVVTPADTQVVGATITITPTDTIITGGVTQITPADTSITPASVQFNHVNYYIDEYVLRNGAYVRVDIDGVKGGRFEPLISNGKLNPIDGTLEFKIEYNQGALTSGANQLFQNGDIRLNDFVRFEIHVVDRALNVSNTITTDPVQILVK